MTLIFPALAVAFAAFCVWLGVRIINRRERWAKWTLAVTILLPVLYVASFGPACWISSHVNAVAPIVNVAYLPMMWIYDFAPEPIQVSIMWYSRIGAHDGWSWTAGNTWRNVYKLSE